MQEDYLDRLAGKKTNKSNFQNQDYFARMAELDLKNVKQTQENIVDAQQGIKNLRLRALIME